MMEQVTTEVKYNRNHDQRGRFGTGGAGGGGGSPIGRQSGGGKPYTPEEGKKVQGLANTANKLSAKMGVTGANTGGAGGHRLVFTTPGVPPNLGNAMRAHSDAAGRHGMRAERLAEGGKAGSKTHKAHEAAESAHRAVASAISQFEGGKSLDMEHTPDDAVKTVGGGFVKALGDGKVGGFLIKYTDANNADLQGDYFTEKSDLGWNENIPVLYHHGRDAMIGKRVIGKAAIVKQEDGVWVEAQLQLRDVYEAHIYKLAEEGKLGWSSGAVAHLVERDNIKGNTAWLKTWWIAEASLTPTPAEPRNVVVFTEENTTSGKSTKELQDAAMVASATEMISFTEAEEAFENEEEETIMTTTETTHEEQIAALKSSIAELTKQFNEPKAEAVKATAVIAERGGDHDGGSAFKHWVRTGKMNYYTKANQPDWNTKAALQEDTGTEGGILVPEGLYTRIITKRDEVSIARKAGALVIQTNLDSVQVPSENAKSSVAIIAEEGSYAETEPTFTSNVVRIYKFGNMMKISDELIADQQTNLDEFIANTQGRQFGVTENTYCLMGTGSSQPKGIVTSGTSGVTAASATAVTAAEIVSLYHSLAEPYTTTPSEVVWVMRNSTLGAIRALASSSIFTFNLQPQGDQGAQMLYGHKVYVSGEMDAMTTGKKPIVLANWSAGTVLVERAGMVMSRNPYLFQANGQVALFTTARFGFTGILAEAITFVTMA